METVEKKIVEKAYEASNKKNVELRKAIELMNELDQGKIEKSAFEHALSKVFCTKCENEMDSSRNEQTDDLLCKRCERKIQEEKEAIEARKKMIENWKKLHQELLQLDSAYELHLKKEDDSICVNDKITVSSYDNTCTIYPDFYTPSSGRYSYHSRSILCLRIFTNDYKVRADKLRKGFDSKNIAESLHKKCKELFKILEAKQKRHNDESMRDANVRRLIESNFGSSIKIENEYRHPRRMKSYSTGRKKFKFESLHVNTSDGEVYRVSGIVKDLTASQVMNLSDFINSL